MCRLSISDASLSACGGVTASGQNVGHAFLRQRDAVHAPKLASFDDLLAEEAITREGVK